MIALFFIVLDHVQLLNNKVDLCDHTENTLRPSFITECKLNYPYSWNIYRAFKLTSYYTLVK